MILTVRLTPRAGSDRIEGWAADAAGRPVLKVRVAAPPVDGAANAALIALLAKQLKRPKSAISLLYAEIAKADGATRAALMEAHLPLRDIVGAMEKALAEALAAAGYDVLNTVKWKPPLDAGLWAPVRAAFAEAFPRLKQPLAQIEQPVVS